MRGKRWFAILVGLVMLTVPTVGMAYTFSGAWTSTDGDVQFMNDNEGRPPEDFVGSVYLYDGENTGISNAIEVMGPGIASTRVEIYQENEIWMAKLSAASDAITIGDNGEFYLYYLGNDTNAVPSYEYSVTESGNDNNTFYLEFSNEFLISVDAIPSPVPVPAAVLLLGSGLIGLVSLRRRSFRG